MQFYLKEVYRSINRLKERLAKSRAGKKEREGSGRLKNGSFQSA